MLTNALAAVDKDLFLFVLKASLQYDITRTGTATDNRSMENSNATKALTSRHLTRGYFRTLLYFGFPESTTSSYHSGNNFKVFSFLFCLGLCCLLFSTPLYKEGNKICLLVSVLPTKSIRLMCRNIFCSVKLGWTVCSFCI